MKTVSINVMNYCVPCENRCRYCLLSYDGRVTGVEYRRSEAYAKRFHRWIRENRPDLSFLFGFGYSMEHPNLLDAIGFCRSIGSATGEFLQFNGMKFRTDREMETLLRQLKEHGIQQIDLTFYGTEGYHDRFAARIGDYRLMMRTLATAKQVDLDVAVSIPVTGENSDQVDILIRHLRQAGAEKIRCFIPHGEGRGSALEPVRLSVSDFAKLGTDVASRINRETYKTEGEWLRSGFPTFSRRMLAVTLTPENMEFFENMPFADTINYLETLDDAYYGAVPPVEELAKCYGNPDGERFFSARDLYLHYQRRYIQENHLRIYDMNDERQCFSRRF